MSLPGVFTLRDRLRAGTEDAHEALDATVSAFDFSCRDGILAFLRFQASALGQLDGENLPLPLLRMIADLRARAIEDLGAAGSPIPSGLHRHAFHPVSCDYVLSGSRLGDQVLRRRWAAHAGRTATGSCFFTAPSYGEMWQSFCNQSGRQPAYGQDADDVVTDATAIFDLFRDVAEDVALGASRPQVSQSHA